MAANSEVGHFDYVGNRLVWGDERSFGLSADDRRQHMYCLGKSGTGKTTLLRNLIVQDIEAGRGVGFIDVHGDLAQELLDLIPSRRSRHVVNFHPGDPSHPVGLNLFRGIPEEKRYVTASNIVGAFKSIWRHSWGVRMEYILFAAISAVLECEETTLLGLQRIFIDPSYRSWVTRQVTDPPSGRFGGTNSHPGIPPPQRDRGPILNKVGALLMTPSLRNVLGQVSRKLDFDFIMDNRRIFIANLQGAELGEDKAGLLGALIIAGSSRPPWPAPSCPNPSAPSSPYT